MEVLMENDDITTLHRGALDALSRLMKLRESTDQEAIPFRLFQAQRFCDLLACLGRHAEDLCGDLARRELAKAAVADLQERMSQA
jgi:hypothetical protein